MTGRTNGRANNRLLAIRTALGLAAQAAPLALAGVWLTALAGAALPVAIAWLTRSLIDRLTDASSAAPGAVATAVALSVTGVAASVLPFADQLLRGQLAREVGVVAQDRLYAAVNAYVGLSRFENPALLDRLRLAQQCGQDAPPQIIASAVMLTRTALSLLGFTVSLAVVSPWLAGAVVLGALPVLRAELRIARAWSTTVVGLTPLERREMFYGQLLTSVHAAKEIRLFGIGGFLRDRMRSDRRVINDAHRAIERRTVVSQILPNLGTAGIAAAGLVWVTHAAAQGAVSVGTVSVVVAGIAAVQSGLGTAAATLAATQQKLVLFESYLDVLTEPSDLPVSGIDTELEPLRSGIELRDVWFRYSDSHDWILRGVNLTVPVGRCLALVGENGAGKTTLVKLLCRFYDPTRGQILWDGVDLRDLPVAQLRGRVSAIFQDFMHYEMTAAENIAVSDLSALSDPARIHAAAERAGMAEKLASLPLGYDTPLTRSLSLTAGRTGAEEGVELSGGQWQRVSMARAFLREDPDLLILDEPTAGLDPAAENRIHQAVRSYREARTSLLISHRLGTVRDADLIVVLKDGVITEQGSHDELIAADGRYRNLFDLQAAGYTATAAVTS
ncbi:ABC transporter ATP-binding protein/permease [Kitasatospora sp. NBC_01250]|uniref:ABC transporter ATP-binding protein n=1 Tax=Kitasatospora sp. NBC_01250 TaxID=2903571 RepID=UPI002E2EB831|nr:ABC transporter ATP-binding protein [Kitasatospora sp. NBC_01250]